MLLVCLDRRSRTGAAIAERGRFAVNILGDGQGDLALHFASKGTDKFAGVEVRPGPQGEPLLAQSLAQLECEVAETASGGTHTIFLAEVRTAQAQPGAPLTYFRGRFGRFVDLRDDATYSELRRHVLERRLPLGVDLAVDALADRLEVDRASVVYALTRLTEEGLVSHEGSGRYAITPVDAPLLTQALEARSALTLGALDLALPGLSDEQARAVRLAAQATVPAYDDDAARAAGEAFHEVVIGLADNGVLVELHERLSVPAILTRALWGVDWSPLQAGLSRDYLRLADALERRDREAAREAVRAYTTHLTEGSVRALEAAGGRV
jgi:4-nitrophenol 2-monooxygenase / 4-nitrocatechol 4-monooxygenase, reductase component